MKKEERRNRYSKNDMCFFVVYIHIPFPGRLGEWIKAIARIAVAAFC